MEKITARIAVSELARKVQVEHLGGGAVEIPNGVAVAKFASAAPLPGWPGEGGSLGFLGRFTESRKGFPILRTAFVTLARERPGLRLLVAGPGDRDDLYDEIPADLHDRVEFLGLVSEADKARMLRSVDVYVAPNTGGESFGMVLTEAMAAGAAIAASDLDAFRRVLDGGRAGALFPTGSAPALTVLLGELLDDPARRAALSACARDRRRGLRLAERSQPGTRGVRHRDRGHRRPGFRRGVGGTTPRHVTLRHKTALRCPACGGYRASSWSRPRCPRTWRGPPTGSNASTSAPPPPAAPWTSTCCAAPPRPRWSPSAPTSVELYAAARLALDAAPDEREVAENDLTRQLQSQPLTGTDPATRTLIATSRRVVLARQVHTDLVRDALTARGRPLVRLLRMARRYPRPRYFDIVEPTLPDLARGGPAPAAGPGRGR